MTLLPLVFIAYAFIAWKDLRVAFLMFIAFLPAYLIRFSLGGVPTTALEVMFVIIFTAWMLTREKRLIDIKGWGWLLLAWIVIATVSMFVSPDLRAAGGVWKAYFIEPILFFLIANDLLRTQTDRENVLKALACSAIVIGVMAVIQHWTGWGVPPPFNGVPVPPATESEFRSTAFYGFPNAIGLYLAPLVPLFVAKTAALFKITNSRGRENSEKWLWSSALILSLAAIVLAQSEGAIVGVIAGLGFLGLMFKKTRLPIMLVGALALTFLLILPATRGLVIEKATLSDWSGRVRTQMWGETWSMLKDRPILGAGLSGYPIVFDTYHKARYIEIFQYPHDVILNFWVETGLAGVIVFALIVWRFMASLRQACLLDAKFHTWTAMLAASMVALLVHGLVDVPYFKNDLALLFWLLLALASSTQAETRKRP